MDKPLNHIKSAMKAYDNKRFLHSKNGRILRLISEYLYPEQKLRAFGIKRTVIFFGSARIHPLDELHEKIAETEILIKKCSKNSEMENLQQMIKVLKNQTELAKYYEEARLLAYRLTEWSNSVPKQDQIHISTGGGPGIMEAANRGSFEAGGQTIGLNISLPFEQKPNPYIHRELNFEFHYFFMRKFWLVYLAQIMVVFPGGFGTIDELMEILTLRQTGKMSKPKVIILYSKDWWTKVINFDYLIDMGMINKDDMELFRFVNSPDEAFELIRNELITNKLKSRFK